MLGFALLITQTALNSTRAQLADRLETSTVKLREMLQTQVHHDVSTLFGRFLPLLEPAKEDAQAREQYLLAQRDRLQTLSESLHAFQHELVR